MSKWDVDYIKLCKRILDEGVEVESRTGVNTIKIPSHHLHFDLSDEFPVLTTKQLYFKAAILDMLWIYRHNPMMLGGYKNVELPSGMSGKLPKMDIGALPKCYQMKKEF